jgi:hypothetical protein
MGLGFNDLLTKAETRLSSILPSAYRKIYEVYTPERETKPVLDRGYGVYFGEMDWYDGATCNFTSQGDLIILLTHYAKIKGDNNTLVQEIYTDIETIIRSFRDGSRLGSDSLVTVGPYRVTQPRLINGDEHLAVELTFNCLFREVK